jgi:hypothetical protein
MKKFIVAILSIFYLGISSGATIHLHYCMDKLVGWKFWHNDAKKCSNCGMEKTKSGKEGCCKDEHQHIKLQSDQKAAEIFQLQQLFSTTITAAFIEMPSVVLPSIAENYPISHAPPRSSATTPVYIIYRSLLI